MGRASRRMSTFKSDFLNVLSSRGFVHQISEPDALDALAERGGLTAYIGFDCTASSLHVGSLIQIMMLYWLQQTGGRPIALMGGGTTRVGDPSGKDESRRLLTDADIAKNLDGIRAVFAKFLRFGDGPGDARMANNADWLNTLNYIDFLRDVGRHFSVNRMLTFDSVKLRLDRQQELSFLEFNYMILQAYDFVELYKRERCVLQMGGSDQWGNIVSGIDLGRRMANAQLFALTTPLLTTSSGAKMGKTAAGAVWLNADMVSPYDYWQYWRNAEDADVARLLEAVHGAAATRDRATRGAPRRRDQRGEEGACDRGDRPRPRARGGEAAAAPPPRQTFEERPRSRRACRRWNFRGVTAIPASWRARRLRRKSAAQSPRMAKRDAQIKAGGLKGQRRDGDRREGDADDRRPHRGGRDQAVARQEAPRPAAAGVRGSSLRAALRGRVAKRLLHNGCKGAGL